MILDLAQALKEGLKFVIGDDKIGTEPGHTRGISSGVPRRNEVLRIENLPTQVFPG